MASLIRTTVILNEFAIVHEQGSGSVDDPRMVPSSRYRSTGRRSRSTSSLLWSDFFVLRLRNELKCLRRLPRWSNMTEDDDG
jgi:hypothetical protein